MTPAYVLLSLGEFASKEAIGRLWKRLFQDDYESLSIGEGKYLLTLRQGLKSLSVLQASFPAAANDLDEQAKGLIVPSPSPLFYPYLDKSENGKICYLFELNEEIPTLYDDCVPLLDGLDDDLLMTVKAYIETERSPNLSALRLFLHRNTVSYRLSRFEEITGIEVDSFGNMMFVYELIRHRLSATAMTNE